MLKEEISIVNSTSNKEKKKERNSLNTGTPKGI